jgi:hypothetical protein
MERSFAWLGHFHRLLIRWERDLVVDRSFFTSSLLLSVSAQRARWWTR